MTCHLIMIISVGPSWEEIDQSLVEKYQIGKTHIILRILLSEVVVYQLHEPSGYKVHESSHDDEEDHQGEPFEHAHNVHRQFYIF